MYWLQKCGLAGWIALFMAVICIPGQAQARPQTEQGLLKGFALAQTCEHEIDDDMSSYGECISHAMDRVAKQRRVLLGVHFQAWLMADLAARQNSTGAQVLRKQHAQAMKRQLRATGITLAQLCQTKQMECDSVRMRMAQQLK